MSTIVIVDYGMGNLRSVSKALEHLGARVDITSDPLRIARADKLVLPGVGAFGDAADGLRRSGLMDPLRTHLDSGRPFLGICLGLQLLFESSEESPGSKGVGKYAGAVRAFRSTTVKVPHMGWNQMKLAHRHPFLKGLPEDSYFYFVHSYFAAPASADVMAGSCSYGGETFAAAVGEGPVLATQFHPEKSQKAGLLILKNFVAG